MTLKEIIKTFMQMVDKFYVRKKDAGNLGKHYSVIIDFSKSDPGGMISYADDVDRAPMSLDWFDILGLKLCVLKEGKVLYYLNPDNVAKQINGSPADITTLGNDVMLEVPRMGTNCMWLDSNRLKITITTAPNRSGYDYRAFSLHKYNDCDKIYIGRYHACLNNNKMYSSSGKTPMESQTLAQHRTYATARGTGYTDIGICDDILLQCLYLLIVKNFNSQSVVGRGIVDNDAKHNTGEANTFGWLNGGSSNRTNGNTAVCCLGLENFWGNIWVWEDGIIKTPVSGNISQQTITMAQYADQYNSNGSGYENIGTFPYTLVDTVNNGRQYGYQGRVAGVPKFIFLPNSSTVSASGRSESTYMCNWHHIELSATTISDFGGRWASGSGAGAFHRSLAYAPSAALDNGGSRLVYKKVAES